MCTSWIGQITETEEAVFMTTINESRIDLTLVLGTDFQGYVSWYVLLLSNGMLGAASYLMGTRSMRTVGCAEQSQNCEQRIRRQQRRGKTYGRSLRE